MITIITGELNSGKSALLLDLVSGLVSAGGFVQKKLVDPLTGRTLGYDLIRLRDAYPIVFARLKDQVPADWEAGPSLGRFSFSRAGIAAALACLEEDLRAGRRPLAVDELGRLELLGQGLAPLLTRLTTAGAILVIRECFLAELTAQLGLEPNQTRVLKPGPREGRIKSPIEMEVSFSTNKKIKTNS